jgi:hypothetical protein
MHDNLDQAGDGRGIRPHLCSPAADAGERR